MTQAKNPDMHGGIDKNSKSNKNKMQFFHVSHYVKFYFKYYIYSHLSMSMNEEPGVTKDQLFCVIVYKGLEHPRILVSAGVPEPVPNRHQGMMN